MQLKTIADLGRFVKAGEQMNAVIGFVATDDENGIIGRNDTESAYGVFREASTKHKESSFGIVKDKELAAACGIRRFPILSSLSPTMRLPSSTRCVALSSSMTRPFTSVLTRLGW
jgi:hypothetical protein